MYAYTGTRGSFLGDLESIRDFRHRKSIFRDLFLKLPRYSSLQQALSAKGFEGPISPANTAPIYACRVHSQNSSQFRVPFAPFRESYIVLNYDGRTDLDFTELAYEALMRYEDAENNNAYEQINGSTYQPPLSYG